MPHFSSHLIDSGNGYIYIYIYIYIYMYISSNIHYATIAPRHQQVKLYYTLRNKSNLLFLNFQQVVFIFSCQTIILIIFGQRKFEKNLYRDTNNINKCKRRAQWSERLDGNQEVRVQIPLYKFFYTFPKQVVNNIFTVVFWDTLTNRPSPKYFTDIMLI